MISFEEIFEKSGFVDVKRIGTGQVSGLDIYKMGGVRMGKGSKTSLLNGA